MLAIVLINHLDEIGEKKFATFGFSGGQINAHSSFHMGVLIYKMVVKMASNVDLDKTAAVFVSFELLISLWLHCTPQIFY